jgi:hypothetical protein
MIFLSGCTDEKRIALSQQDGGIGSGAFYLHNEPKDIFYTISDTAPTIYKIKLHENNYTILQKIPIRSSKKIDTEALIKLKDGTFWVADERIPSLLHVAADGRVLQHVVPKKKLKKRQKNKGFESLAISEDEKHLYFALQAPMKKDSKKLSIYRYHIKKERITKEYPYKLDKKSNYLSEMVMMEKGKLVVIEKEKDTYKFYQVDTRKTDPQKKLLFTYNRLQKIEGVAYRGDDRWILINDDDAGRDGLSGYIVLLN